ncbi:hypothetical protein HBI56_153020 [Parastagonospora nodorum]|nr:hypothetical protein HBH51_153130 [Parastagonospora nodorum]KAH5181059.1 hypothetical protein HBH76_164320 [Parastagonospora nodorum]KAH5815028.1 hypothetical protein HBI94_134450 [Parastagonospora nodorum]KAH5949050.1 hypothetical protein HBI87_106260 [Parastagonospora nodorum]KAH6212439.1 hypothetical protein HBI15_140390 [Parastagonospora nodorum]
MMLGCAELSADRVAFRCSSARLVRFKIGSEFGEAVKDRKEHVSCFKPGYSHHQVLLGECRDLTKRGN